jgi:hypothetical protein
MSLSTWLWLAAALAAALALAVGWPRRRGRGRGRGRRNGLRALSGVALLVLAAVALVGGLLLRQYQWLLEDVPVATISLRQLGPQSFEATLASPGRAAATLPLHGDEWQLDARVIRWKLPAALAGVRPMYSLERLSGRYGDPKQELTARRDVHDLRARWDFWQFQQRWLSSLPLADARWGSAAYLPMIDGANYNVMLAPRGGLVAKPADDDTARKLREAGW